jgi:hypothetical protein
VALFSRKSQGSEPQDVRLVPVQTEYDDAWFDRHWQEIFAQSGIAPDDQDRLQLIMMTNFTLDDTAKQTFSQLGLPQIQAAYLQETDQPDCTPAKRVGLLANWKPEFVPVLMGRLEKFRDSTVQGIRSAGKARFFTSDCCGKPLEAALPSLDMFCSNCGKAA